jgi:transmembrane 9 superfamily protein 1
MSVWGRNSYTLFGILLLVLIILLCVTSAMTIAMAYFQVILFALK